MSYIRRALKFFRVAGSDFFPQPGIMCISGVCLFVKISFNNPLQFIRFFLLHSSRLRFIPMRLSSKKDNLILLTHFRAPKNIYIVLYIRFLSSAVRFFFFFFVILCRNSLKPEFSCAVDRIFLLSLIRHSYSNFRLCV